jgi:predicted lipoprotein
VAEHSTPTDALPRAPLPWPWIVIGVVTVALFVVYPPFRIVNKSARQSASGGSATAAFDAASFALEFWADKLLPATATASDAALVLAELRRDPAAAAKAHAHRVGLGNASYYFARGSGRVTAVERNRLLVEIGGAIVAIRSGPVFGNAVRDGCGLLDVNDVPGLAEFNALSAELNRLVEERVQPALKGATVGATLTFAGCAEAPESWPAGGPLLTFIPVQVELAP